MTLPFIPFNRPHIAGKEAAYLLQCLQSRKWCGNGPFTQEAEALFERRFKFKKILLTPSCTSALEMAAVLSRVGHGDEVILPSYTFVSTANPFAMRGANLVFADSTSNHPNLDPAQLDDLTTNRTRAIIIMHYGGVACDMEPVLAWARRRQVLVIEDAAHCIDARYGDQPLGGMGHLGTFSFHETKNITCGEGGALAVNDHQLIARAEVVREKGTNRASFFRGEIDKYGWVDIGSSHLPSEFAAAMLMAQLEEVDAIQNRRVTLWDHYHTGLDGLARRGDILLPELPPYASQNAHVFYLVTDTLATRTQLMAHLKTRGIGAAFHYQSLHRSPYFKDRHDGRPLPHADRFTDCLLRLPLFAELANEEADRVVEAVTEFFCG